MMNDPETNGAALLSIGALSRLSEIPVETLRTWERRYGFPEPVRLASGHRRYSSEILPRLRLVRRATDLGFKASFALVAGMEELESAVRETERLGAKAGTIESENEFVREVALWLETVQRLDAVGFEVALRRAWSKNGALDFIVKIAVPFLERVGERWFEHHISVAHEHFTSEHLSSFLSNQWRPISKHAKSGKAVVANLEGEQHHLGIHMAAIFLALSHFEVIFLGANTPLEDIIIATQESGVVTTVIGLSATSDLQKCERMLIKLRTAVPSSITIVTGGNEHLKNIKGITHIDSLDNFADFTRSLSVIYSGTG